TILPWRWAMTDRSDGQTYERPGDASAFAAPQSSEARHPLARVSAKARRWWVAGLFALFGLSYVGYLYLGRPRRALLPAAARLVWLLLLLGFGSLFDRPEAGLAVIGVAAALWLFFVVDCIVIASRSSVYVPRWYNRWWTYAGIIFLVMVT